MSKEKLKNIRVTVANKAAELISEEGITDYHYAKTKAAKFLGLNTKEKLPSNTFPFKKTFAEYLIFSPSSE